MSRDAAIAEAESLARQRAAEAGAEASSIVVLEAEDIPIAYLPGDARRVRVRVVGDIDFGKRRQAA
jgi:N-methylhydantoinase A/oxoprolinase/acetone carboxylase beta subunit